MSFFKKIFSCCFSKPATEPLLASDSDPLLGFSGENQAFSDAVNGGASINSQSPATTYQQVSQSLGTPETKNTATIVSRDSTNEHDTVIEVNTDATNARATVRFQDDLVSSSESSDSSDSELTVSDKVEHRVKTPIKAKVIKSHGLDEGMNSDSESMSVGSVATNDSSGLDGGMESPIKPMPDVNPRRRASTSSFDFNLDSSSVPSSNNRIPTMRR